MQRPWFPGPPTWTLRYHLHSWAGQGAGLRSAGGACRQEPRLPGDALWWPPEVGTAGDCSESWLSKTVSGQKVRAGRELVTEWKPRQMWQLQDLSKGSQHHSWDFRYLFNIFTICLVRFVQPDRDSPHVTMRVEKFDSDVFRQLMEFAHTGKIDLQPRTITGIN